MEHTDLLGPYTNFQRHNSHMCRENEFKPGTTLYFPHFHSVQCGLIGCDPQHSTNRKERANISRPSLRAATQLPPAGWRANPSHCIALFEANIRAPCTRDIPNTWRDSPVTDSCIFRGTWARLAFGGLGDTVAIVVGRSSHLPNSCDMGASDTQHNKV
jgi:hypothetical protein